VAALPRRRVCGKAARPPMSAPQATP